MPYSNKYNMINFLFLVFISFTIIAMEQNAKHALDNKDKADLGERKTKRSVLEFLCDKKNLKPLKEELYNVTTRDVSEAMHVYEVVTQLLKKHPYVSELTIEEPLFIEAGWHKKKLYHIEVAVEEYQWRDNFYVSLVSPAGSCRIAFGKGRNINLDFSQTPIKLLNTSPACDYGEIYKTYHITYKPLAQLMQ